MTRSLSRGRPLIAGLIVLVASLGFASCGGGGTNGGGGGGVPLPPAFVATSFQGFPAAPGGGLPPIFRDEVLLFTLNQSIDTNILGGFVMSGGGTPLTFTGFSSNNAQGVQYFAFSDQMTANAALQIVEDASLMQHLGIIGISAANPRVLVFDPKVPFGNQFGLAGTQGLTASVQYDVFVPPNGPITLNGMPLPVFGSPPPVMPPPFNPSPPAGFVLATGAGFAPDTIPPTVVDITSTFLQANGGNPATDPIPHDDTIVVTFSEAIDLASLNLQANLIVRNTSVTNSSSADIGGGVFVPVIQTADPTQRMIFLTPNPSFGNGPFTISVEVGFNVSTLDEIFDLPAGVNGTQRGLGNSLARTFTTQVTTGQQTGASIPEDFEDTDQLDTTFNPTFEACLWNQPFGPQNLPSGQLRGFPITGSATMGGGGLGTGPGARTQTSILPMGVVNPAVCPQPVCNYFSPFDDSNVNNLGAAVNPNGGSHTQLLYMQGNNELPNNLATAIELYEWNSPPSTGAFTFTFNAFTMRMGHTSASAASPTSPEQLTVLYDRNFNFDNPQNSAFINPTMHPDPGNNIPNESPVVVTPTQPYFIGQFTIAPGFIPYPLLTLPFDFDGNRTEADITGTQVNPNLVVDINIAAPVAVNGNVLRGTNVNMATPFRRLIGAPGAVSSFALDAVAYQGRFTFVKKNSSARTFFYDLGMGTLPNYVGIDLSPAIGQRPAGTSIRMRVLGADMPGPPVIGATGNQEYISRDGVVNPGALAALAGKRFIRMIIDMEAATAANLEAFIEGLLIGYTF